MGEVDLAVVGWCLIAWIAAVICLVGLMASLIFTDKEWESRWDREEEGD